MRIIIFGSTGTIGRELVIQSLEQGHIVTAFARKPAKLEIKHNNLNPVAGNVLDPIAVQQAVANHDAVMVALGAGRKGTVRSEGTLNIIRAMEQTGMKRLICLSTLGAGDSSKVLNFFWKYVMFGLLLRTAYADHQLQEKFIKKSSLHWTIVRPAAFTDGDSTGEYRHGFSSSEKNLSLTISRADVADFMLKQLGNDQYLQQAPGLSY